MQKEFFFGLAAFIAPSPTKVLTEHLPTYQHLTLLSRGEHAFSKTVSIVPKGDARFMDMRQVWTFGEALRKYLTGAGFVAYTSATLLHACYCEFLYTEVPCPAVSVTVQWEDGRLALLVCGYEDAVQRTVAKIFEALPNYE